MSAERRRFPRVIATVPGRVRRLGSGDDWEEVQVLNVSLGGLRFSGQTRFESSAAVTLQVMLLSHDDETEIRGSIVWTRSLAAGVQEVGVEFKTLEAAQREKIETIVEWLLHQPSPGHG